MGGPWEGLIHAMHSTGPHPQKYQSPEPTPSKKKKSKATSVKAETSAQDSDEDPFVVKSPAKKMRKTPKGKRSKSSSKVSSKKTDISDSSSRGSSDEMDVELDSSPLSKKSVPYGKEFDKSIAKAKKMQVDNKKAMRKLGKEIADDEAEIEKYEESGKEGSDGDDDDLPSEGKKKHIKQV
ncbi:uncharacterized protein LACBIDRAFT_335958 [Laccaria bicolor S238N-H82]|uniref:Predicted protein n=1 Tax=Laccaria bicolor (strain S238N-H82 / ATCC MYA-4686) TaxID=486041 RepID=B0E3Y5_LACBS|nr:uncharacterized protein LACBIDRAFT_335958 [Laccaria bicolor S238N-H82]EDQ98445.1 predicted protein [Laccaria bicolor S238N-H82]|eukprot:XP_001890903.1 predicted protein [Laccaria bicolor S238N-H82]